MTKTETPVLEKLFTDHLNKDRLIILYTKATLYAMVGIALTVECKIITFTDDREFISRELRSKFNLIENHKSKPSIRAFKTKKFQKLDFEKQLNSWTSYPKNVLINATFGDKLNLKNENEETKRKLETSEKKPKAEWRKVFYPSISKYGIIENSQLSTIQSISSIPTAEFYQRTIDSTISKIK